jgi:hypothetical protein
MVYTAKTFTHGDDVFVEIPDALLAAKGWHIGDTLSLSLTDGGIQLTLIAGNGIDTADMPNL